MEKRCGPGTWNTFQVRMVSQPTLEPESSVSSAYSAQQFQDNYASGMERHWWSRSRANIVCRALSGFRDDTILDVGCGPGIVVRHLRKAGYECFGCDLGIPTVLYEVQDAVWTRTEAAALGPGFRGSVSVILLLDVLEHLKDPDKFLLNLLGAFPNLKAVILTVPARQELWSAWDQHFGHYRRYDRHSLLSLCKESGLRPLTLRYFFHAIYPALFTVARITGRATKSKVQQPRSLLNILLTQVFTLEARLPIGRIFGSSLLTVAVPER